MRLVAFSALLCTTVFTFVAALPGPSAPKEVIYGYREVSKEQAKRYNDAGTLTDDPNVGEKQIGLGVYTSPVRNGWLKTEGKWYCVIYGSSEALKELAKLWIPARHNGQPMWYADDTTIDGYVRSFGLDPKKTLKLASISGFEEKTQMVIPHDLLNSRGGGLRLRVKCFEKWESLPRTTVKYESWKNVKGSRYGGT